MKGLKIVSLALIVIGGLNWLLFGLFQWDLVGGILSGMDSIVSRIVYVVVGLAALYSFTIFKDVKN